MKRKLYMVKISLLAVILQVFSLQLKAIDEKYAAAPLRGSNNQIAADSSSIVQDTVFYNLSLRPVQTTFKVKDYVIFKLDEFANIALPDTFKVTITFKVYFSKLVSGSVVLDSSAVQTVYVEYNKFRNYQSRATYAFSGGYRSEVKILSVSSSSSSGTFNDYKTALVLENQIVVTREYAFEVNADAVQSVSGAPGTEDLNSCSSEGEYVVSWAHIRAADEYDLEWAYIDSAAMANYYLPSTTDPDPKKIFANNATRVSIDEESYEIPLLFDDHGYLFYRVRAVQVRQTGQRIESSWSSNYSGGLGTYDFPGHERFLNWQSSISFAEEGKRKAVVQYFDGTLRNRQTVTKDNSTCFTIVAETLYDFQGRPAIQVLPAPTLSKLIGYTPGFNNDLNGAPYDKTLFDADTTGGINNCNAVVPGMDTTTGASKYYSLANSLVNTGFHKYIPDARLYPFSETRYTPDNTGRIAMQGGVGTDFQINRTDADGHTHETSYFYGSADQEELDALFGTEAGNASHYSKNMVRDANGQYSVSYVDMHGRTVATALAGKPESKLDTLPSSNNKTIIKKLLDPSNNLVIGTSIISTKDLLVTMSGLHRFQYALLPDSISVMACDSVNICYDCLYDLDITISNDCSNPDNSPITIHRSNLSISGILDTACNANTAFPGVDSSINLTVGTYTITKTLTVSEVGLSRYNEIFLRRNTCKTLQQFIEEQKLAFLAGIECYPTCQSCADSLGTWEEYRIRYMINNSIPPADTASFQAEARLAYNEQKEACDALCNQTGLHNSIHDIMVTDMTYPYGQYAIYDSAFDSHNIFYTVSDGADRLHFKDIPAGTYFMDESGRPDSIVVNSSGTRLPPTDPSVTAQQFADNFKPGWVETLLPLHPEYNKLLMYESYAASFIWDDRFQKIETFKQAVDSGFLNPFNIAQGAGNLPVNAIFDPPASGARDPFFTTLATSGVIHDFKDTLLHYVYHDGFDISAWSLATIMAHCEPADSACIVAYSPMAQAFSMDTACSGELDFAWRYFRQMYLNKKAQVINDLIYNAYGQPELLSWQNENFPHLNLLDGSTDMGAANDADGRDSVTKYISDNCHAYANQWLIEMEPCNLTQTDIDAILPRLIGVCEAGGDQAHIFGSSTTRPGTYASGDSSFIQVLKEYLGDRYDSSCNAFLLTAPKPYDAQPPYGDIQIYDHPDSCQCEKLSVFYQQFRASGESSFADYISRVTGVSVPQSTLDSLRMLCNHEISCRFISSPLILPPVLQCNIGSKCISCTAMDLAYQEYISTFPGSLPAYDNNDSMQQKRNLLFEHFMNYRFGFAKSYLDYLEFMDTCHVKVVSDSSHCDSLQNILSAYQYDTNNQYVPHYDTGGCDTSMIKINTGNNINDVSHTPTIHLADWMYNGVLKVPFGDTTDISPSFIYNDTLCIDSVFTYEARLRFPVSDSGYVHWSHQQDPARYGDFASSFQFNDKQIIYGFVNGKYYRNYLADPDAASLHDSIYFISTVIENGIQTATHQYLSTGMKYMSDWVSVKTVVKDQKVKFYLQNVLFDSISLTSMPDWFYNNITKGNGSDLQIDWIKMYDKKNRLRYFEDFNGCDKMGGQTLGHDCSADCATGFSSYFNSHTGNAYTYAQIDSLYFTGCGLHPDPCYRNPVDCNQLKQVIVDYYHSKFNIRYDSTGFENSWGQGTNYVLRSLDSYEVSDFFVNGIITVPDTVTYLKGDFGYKFRIPMCVGNEFSWETRVRAKPGTDFTAVQPMANFVTDNPGHVLIEFTGNSGADGFEVYYIANNYHDTVSLIDYNQDSMHSVQFDGWRTLKYIWKNNKVYVYVDGILKGETIYPGNFNKLESFALYSWFNGPMDIDYVKIWDRYGVLQYTEDLTDYTNFTKVPFVFICPPVNCSSGFTSFFNNVFATGYNYNQIVDIYKRQCGMEFESCGAAAGPTLCGDLQPVFPPMQPEPLTPCADSTLFSDGVGTLLYNAYHDSLINAFNDRYLQKCLQAGSHESFTVTAPVSEFHYTLYYYDQAGNLVKTVPPAGVNTGSFSIAHWSDTVRAKLAAGLQLTPTHSLETQYRYNTLNQVIAQHTPDAGSSHFWYDRLGRLVLSQNASQKPGAELNALYSYTLYDYLGRITEVGQIRNDDGDEPITHLITRNPTYLSDWFNDRINYRGQLTQTVYDLPYAGFAGQESSTIWQRNLRNRVSYTTITDTITNSYFNQATFYSYDIHGNVDTLLQDYGSTNGIHNIMNIQYMNNNRWKRMVYNYDLISGKLNRVAYQPPRGATYYADMFYHRYAYDAGNRLILAETSMDSISWEKEARYEYYRHGPLARTVTGEQLVQGTDYAYTLQGWLKGVNATGGHDMGRDGKPGHSNQYIARDAVGFSLNYFSGAYAPINASVTPFPNATAYFPAGEYRPLYNGNISSMAVSSRFPGSVPQLYNYRYDQLNRITGMDTYRGFDSAANSWASMAVTTDYKERIAYDANGNILKYLRNGVSSVNTKMDSLSYNYFPGTNQLKFVRDSVPDNIYSLATADLEDIDNQTTSPSFPSNYTYTEIGDLKTDRKDSIKLIKWNVYGKITEIQRNPSTARPISKINYTYDAAGNRISKKIERSTDNNHEYTWYVRDAAGNVMATYYSIGARSNSPLSSNYNLLLKELDIYGSSRVGLINRNTDVKTAFVNPQITTFERGNKFFELTNQTGNVLATISDKKIPHSTDGTTIDYYDADVVTANDYYPGGMNMPGRKYNQGASSYRYSINGQEKESALNENITTALYWEYDSRIVRRWNVDPKPNMSISPYSCFNGNPIFHMDVLGDSGILPRVFGGLKLLGGVIEAAAGAVGGAATSWTGVGAVVGGAAVIHGADVATAGLKQLWTGEESSTLTSKAVSKGLQAVGVKPGTADAAAGYVDAGLSIGFTFGAYGLTAKAAIQAPYAVGVEAQATNEATTTVGRWMSKAEYQSMLKTGRMVEGAGGQTFVSTGGANAFKAAAKGSVYAEFEVSANSLLQGGQVNWFKAIGPNASKAMQGALQKQGGQLSPAIENLTPILQTK